MMMRGVIRMRNFRTVELDICYNVRMCVCVEMSLYFRDVFVARVGCHLTV
jgi:hypothetical protein